ncbi:MAG: DUF58 domain-containing protein [Coleofasciculaceae cyanobacterium SM2_1_6]|nr:DUF58 domain-containing protein [Coleofasciculaceae cyanobacterium SM2_1_6]
MIPSTKTYFLLFLGIILGTGFAHVLTINSSIAITAGFDFVVLALAVIDRFRSQSHRVQVERLPLGKLSIGRDNSVHLIVNSGIDLSKEKNPSKSISNKLTSKSNLSKKLDRATHLAQSSPKPTTKPTQIKIYDHYPWEFTTDLQKQPKLPLEALIDDNSSIELSYHVYPQHRGEFKWGNLQVRQLGRWGLAWDSWTVQASTPVRVYPDLIGLRQLTVKLTTENSSNRKRSQRLGMGTEFSELREYRAGDDPRLIDWKATARKVNTLQPLQVRVLEPEQEQTLIILLDRGRLMTSQVQGLARFDWGLNAALALALTGLHRGDRVGIGVFDRKMHTWLPPERGQNQISRLVESLTPIQPELLEPDYMGAVTHLVQHQSRRALIVVITDIIDSTASGELLAALTRLTPRYLPFCVTLRDPEVDRQAQALTPDLRSAYIRAVALDLMVQRNVAFARLKQQGVLVLDAPVSQISEQLIDRYLQLKARNLL